MRHLNKPNFKVKEIVEKCASSYKDKLKANRFLTCSEYIKIMSNDYDIKASKGEWSKISKECKVNKIITASEMIEIYKNKFVGNKYLKQEYYDKILLLSPYGKCPICGVGQVSTLDHYLAKSLYPTYTITPFNLVPVCRDCNSNKADLDITTDSNAPFHPYYDTIDNLIWLCANIEIQDGMIVSSYFISHQIKLDDIELYNRLNSHFNLYKLSKIYSIQASTEIAENTVFWKQKYIFWGKKEFKEYLSDCLSSKEKYQKNTWNTALLRAIIENVEIFDKLVNLET